MPNFNFLAGWSLLALATAMVVPATARADGYTCSANCDNAFNFSDSFPTQRVVLLPSPVRAGRRRRCAYSVVYMSLTSTLPRTASI